MQVYQLVKTLVGVIGDSERIRALLEECQQAEYDKTKAVEQHMPTRFATLHFCALSLKKTKEAIRRMCTHDKWQESSSGSQKAAEVLSTVLGAWHAYISQRQHQHCTGQHCTRVAPAVPC